MKWKNEKKLKVVVIRGKTDESSGTEFKIYSISSFSASQEALGQLG